MSDPAALGGRLTLRCGRSVSHRAARAIVVLVCGAVATSACSQDRNASSHPATFADVFSHSDSVHLEEPAELTIGRLSALSPSVSGDTLAILDHMNHQVRLHSRTGELLTIRGSGKAGDGPGEFNIPYAADWDIHGHLWISEQANSRLTRLRHDLSLDTIVSFFTREPLSVTAIARAGDVLVTRVRPAVNGLKLALIDTAGSVVRHFHPSHPRADAPYWVQFAAPMIAASDSLIAVGFSMEYPLKLYSSGGEVVTEQFGQPPPSWRQARVPAYGEFAVGAGNSPIDWRMSFTRVHALGLLGNECLLVVHEVPDPASEIGFQPVYLADLYDLSSGTKLLEDADLPGRFLYARDSAVYFLTDIPPSPWTVDIWATDRCA